MRRLVLVFQLLRVIRMIGIAGRLVLVLHFLRVIMMTEFASGLIVVAAGFMALLTLNGVVIFIVGFLVSSRCGW